MPAPLTVTLIGLGAVWTATAPVGGAIIATLGLVNEFVASLAAPPE